MSKTIEDGKILIPIFGKYNTGMQNIGNSCYMNSVVQTVFSHKAFQDKYIKNAADHLISCKNFAPDCF